MQTRQLAIAAHQQDRRHRWTGSTRSPDHLMVSDQTVDAFDRGRRAGVERKAVRCGPAAEIYANFAIDNADKDFSAVIELIRKG